MWGYKQCQYYELAARSKDVICQRQNALLAEYEREYGRLPTFNQKSSA